MIPQLPTEITRRILQLSLPPTKPSTFPIRYNHLRSLALVNSVFGSLAQEELFQHIFIADITRWSLLCLLLEAEHRSSSSSDVDYPGARIKSVQIMYIGFPSHHSQDRLSQLLKLAPNVESVHLEGVGSVDFSDLSVAPKLRSIYLSKLYDLLPPLYSDLPPLQSLSLHDLLPHNFTPLIRFVTCLSTPLQSLSIASHKQHHARYYTFQHMPSQYSLKIKHLTLGLTSPHPNYLQVLAQLISNSVGLESVKLISSSNVGSLSEFTSALNMPSTVRTLQFIPSVGEDKSQQPGIVFGSKPFSELIHHLFAIDEQRRGGRNARLVKYHRCWRGIVNDLEEKYGRSGVLWEGSDEMAPWEGQ